MIPLPADESQVDDNQPMPQLREPAAANDAQLSQVLEGNKAFSSQNFAIPTTLRKAYADIVLFLSNNLPNDQIYKAYRDSNLNA